VGWSGGTSGAQRPEGYPRRRRTCCERRPLPECRGGAGPLREEPPCPECERARRRGLRTVRDDGERDPTPGAAASLTTPRTAPTCGPGSPSGRDPAVHGTVRAPTGRIVVRARPDVPRRSGGGDAARAGGPGEAGRS
jgi:hypothetical protein